MTVSNIEQRLIPPGHIMSSPATNFYGARYYLEKVDECTAIMDDLEEKGEQVLFCFLKIRLNQYIDKALAYLNTLPNEIKLEKKS